jgi:hypothetical protein
MGALEIAAKASLAGASKEMGGKELMKIRSTLPLAVVTALAVAPLAMAKLSMPPQALGQMEATLKFCSNVNPKAEANYKELGKMLVKDATEEELTKARASSAYKESYDSITERLGKAPKDKALESCAAAFPAK